MRFFPRGLSRRPQEMLHPGTTRTPQEVALRVQGNQASPGGHKRIPARELQESLREPSGSLREFPGTSGSFRELLRASGNPLGASGSFQELPGTFGSLQELSGAFATFGMIACGEYDCQHLAGLKWHLNYMFVRQYSCRFKRIGISHEYVHNVVVYNDRSSVVCFLQR